MRKKGRSILAVLLMVAIMCGMTGCLATNDAQKEIHEETQVGNEENIGSIVETNKAQQKQDNFEEQEENMVNYGDNITFSCDIIEQPIQWEDVGEAVFQVATTSEQFQNEFDFSEDVTYKKVNQAIGKTVGETFTLWFEGGDGLYGYEYTILEVVDKPADKVTYGDKIYTSYTMRGLGVDMMDGTVEWTGEREFNVTETEKILANAYVEFSLNATETKIAEIVGKGIGDTFQIIEDSPEKICSYRCTILGIDKAVEYGDTIKVSVRRASILSENREDVSSEEEIQLELLTPQGTINLAGNELSMKDTKLFLKEMQGKSVGDRIIFSNIAEAKRIVYDISILNIEARQAGEEESDLESLMLADEENVKYIYDGEGESAICYAVVTDTENNMVYEYVRDDYDKSFWLEFCYSYEAEYDQQGRLIRETYGGNLAKIIEFKYNEQDICVERKLSFPNVDDMYFDYYDEEGRFIKSEEFLQDGSRYIREYEDGNSNRIKITYYDPEGNISIYIEEYDEWGLPIEA